MIDETDVELAPHRPPLFQVALELHEPDLVFVPSLGEQSEFMDLILTLEDDIFNVGKLVERVAKHKQWPDYEVQPPNSPRCPLNVQIWSYPVRQISMGCPMSPYFIRLGIAIKRHRRDIPRTILVYR